jgi:hypothetical protein
MAYQSHPANTCLRGPTERESLSRTTLPVTRLAKEESEIKGLILMCDPFRKRETDGSRERWNITCSISENTAMPWYQFALNKKTKHRFFFFFFFLDCPILDEISLFSVELDRDGPCLQLRFDLKEFPAPPPAKWVLEHYNRAQVTVDFLEVEGLRIEGWGRNNPAQMKVADAGGRLSVLVQGSEFSIRFKCYAFRIASISGYCDPQK